MQLWRQSNDIRDARFDTEELRNSESSRRSFLARSAGSVVGIAGGAAVLNAVMAAPAGAAVGDTTLITPVRVFDSRPGQSYSGDGEGAGTTFTYTGTPADRLVFFGEADADVDLIPEASQGAIINLTVTGTVATGALGVTAGSDTAAPSASLINWFGNSQNLANSALVPTDSVNTKEGNAAVAAINVWVIAGTPNVSSSHFIVDCFGHIQ